MSKTELYFVIALTFAIILGAAIWGYLSHRERQDCANKGWTWQGDICYQPGKAPQ